MLDAELITRAIRRDLPKAVIDRVATRAEFVTVIAKLSPRNGEGKSGDGPLDIVVSDYALPGYDGFEALDHVRTQAPELPFVFVSGVLGEEIAIESLRRGATDYVLKQRLERLPGVISRAIAEARERAERRRAEDHQLLLIAELSHRVKNTLATVLSMARQTIQGSETLQDFEDLFMGRVVALSEAHGLLFRTNWDAAPLSDVADRVFRPLGPLVQARVHREGPALRLNPRTTLSLSLVLHELAVNAVHFGSLSTGSGRLDLVWRLVDGNNAARVVVEWRERGGPVVVPPARRGFGLKLLERSMAYELSGSSETHFDAEGFWCRLEFPLRKAGQAPLRLQGWRDRAGGPAGRQQEPHARHS